MRKTTCGIPPLRIGLGILLLLVKLRSRSPVENQGTAPDFVASLHTDPWHPPCNVCNACNVCNEVQDAHAVICCWSKRGVQPNPFRLLGMSFAHNRETLE
jgi:hypothetical protein